MAFRVLFTHGASTQIDSYLGSRIMSVEFSLLCGVVVGVTAFFFLVGAWVVKLLVEILESLRCIEHLLHPNYFQRLGLEYPVR